MVALVAPALPVFAGPPLVKATLLAATSGVQKGQRVPLGVEVSIQPGWHIYWLHPGDAGMPTRVSLAEVPGVTLEPVRWTTPSRFLEESGYQAIGYANEQLFPLAMTVGEVAGKSVALTGTLTWLVCKDECIRGSTPLSLTLPVVDVSVVSPSAERIQLAEQKVPQRVGRGAEAASSPVQVAAASSVGAGETLSITVTPVAKPGVSVSVEEIFLDVPLSFSVTKPEILPGGAAKTTLEVPGSGAPASGTSLGNAVVVLVEEAGGKRTSRSVVVELPTKMR